MDFISKVKYIVIEREKMKFESNGNTILFSLPQRIDSTNAASVEKDIMEVLNSGNYNAIEFDAETMEYISSAGLRIILRIQKKYQEVIVINASDSVYDIFSVTGFTDIIWVLKKLKNISVQGCELIGEGKNGKVYRLNDEVVIKVFRESTDLETIYMERELTRFAFVAGINTIIPFDVVMVDEKYYGTVYELSCSPSVTSQIRKKPEKTDEYIRLMVNVLKDIHKCTTDIDEIPSAKEKIIEQTEYIKDYFDSNYYEKLCRMHQYIPESNHIVHNDFHLNNVNISSNGEAVILDMETLSKGDPIMEFSSMYASFQAFRFFGDNFFEIDMMQLSYIWEQLVREYFGVEDISEIEDKCKLIVLPRVLRWALRKDPNNTQLIEFCKNTLIELIDSKEEDFLK